MKANELRIGNWVTENGRLIHIHDGFGIDHAHNFEPIPLTEEWLLKFGFVKNKNTFILNKDASVTHEKTGYEKGFWYSNDESNAYCYRLKKIEFVHQLQNLFFALSGEEL